MSAWQRLLYGQELVMKKAESAYRNGSSQEQTGSRAKASSDGTKYTCPMHPEVIGEFSNDTLAYKLELLNGLFWQTEQKFSARPLVKSNLDELTAFGTKRSIWRRDFCAANFT